MDQDLSLVAVVGSLRTGSFSRIVFEAAAGLTGDGVTLIEHPVADIPLYNQDVEDAGAPSAVTDFQAAVADADGLVFFTPEYNRSIPAVTKNCLDWLSRPYGAAPIRDKPTGIVAVVPGHHHGEGVRAHLGDTVGVLTVNLHQTSLGVSSIRHRIEDDVLTDRDALHEIEAWLGEFAAHVRESVLAATHDR